MPLPAPGEHPSPLHKTGIRIGIRTGVRRGAQTGVHTIAHTTAMPGVTTIQDITARTATIIAGAEAGMDEGIEFGEFTEFGEF